ncbi:hypothetical protein QR680_011488 [Steinernema hermaphroditum]|uniref:Uncharacterized protein n=1 Tax=Steinernema hermaphroditum TaxID=289476 RepID=A0AA39HYN8_9BILA|nr:hypothetical protein QR680_011488 [Steinernema hermaphroditum]
MGRIVEVLKSADHEIRAAKVRLPSSKILTRPLSKLYPFSTSSPTEEPQTEKKGDPPSGNTVAETISASVRVCIPPLKFYLQMMLVLCLEVIDFWKTHEGFKCDIRIPRVGDEHEYLDSMEKVDEEDICYQLRNKWNSCMRFRFTTICHGHRHHSLADLLQELHSIDSQVSRQDALSLSLGTFVYASEEQEVSAIGGSIVVEGSRSSDSEDGSAPRRFSQKMRSRLHPLLEVCQPHAKGLHSLTSQISRQDGTFAVNDRKRRFPIGRAFNMQ